jgi:tRNA threonylcarbamoyladenosine biosynthesis protein TsaB
LLILALDTTTRGGSVAVTDDDRVLAVRAGDATRTHGERLPAEIDATLADAGIEPRAINLLVVASGPGAFTGLRIGLAAMQGLAMTLSRPIVGVSALDALAWTAVTASDETNSAARDLRSGGSSDRPIIAAWMDAARGEVFSALYRPALDRLDSSSDPAWTMAGEPIAGAPDAMMAIPGLDRQAAAHFVGDGARRYAAIIRAASPVWTVSDDDPLLTPALAWLGRRLAQRGLAGPPHALQPLYIRRPDVEIERERLRGTPAGDGGQVPS